MPYTRLVLLSMLLGVVTALPIAASAQELEEVTVTATRRETTEFETPLSIETLTGEQIAKAGIKDFEDLSAVVPNLFVGDGVVTTSIMIRGAGSGTERSFEQTVGMFLDGVYMPRSRQYRNPFFDANRVEVIRGPQAVLFGLNSTAGAVSVVSNKSMPGDDPFLEIGGAYESEFGGTRFTAIAGGGVGDNVGLRLAAQFSDSGDGFISNLFDGSDSGASEEMLLRLTAVFEPTDNSRITLRYNHAEFDIDDHTVEFYTVDETCGGGLVDGNCRRDWINNIDRSLIEPLLGYQPGLFQELDNFKASAEWGVGENTLSFNVAYSDYTYDFATELDLTPVPALDAALTEDYEQTSAEFRITSPTGDKVEYIVGAYYSTSDLFNTQPTTLNLGLLAPAFAGQFDLAGSASTQEADTISVFGQVTWNLSDTARLTVGARYNDEEKSIDRSIYCDIVDATGTVLVAGVSAALCPPAGAFSDSRSSSNFMPEVIFEKDFGESSMFYGKVASSAKSGGYVFSGSAPSTDALEYGDETALSFEAGIKSRFADGRGELSVAAFHTTFEDLQVNSFQGDGQGGFVSVTTNAGESESVGLEAELRYAASEVLTLSVNAAYLDAEFTSFDLAPCYVGETDPDGDGICNHTGSTVPYAPELAATIAADLGGGIGNGKLEWFARASVSHSGEYLTDGTLDPAAEQDSYQRVDANFGIGAADGKWDVSLVGRNLTDEYVLNVSQAGSFGGYLGYPSRPRTYSLQGRIRF